jgi:Cu(I)/Ag(I) efflux system membrane fusion protein
MTRRRHGLAVPLVLVLVAVAFAAGLFFGGGSAPAPAPKPQQSAQVWTCSMHPQIRLPEPGACPICGMDLIPAGSGDDHALDPDVVRLGEAARKLARVETAPVVRRAAVREVAMVGKVTYDETRVETIAARFAGRLDRLFVDYTGVPVKTGDHLASIYSPELLSAQQELLQALRASKEVRSHTVPFLRETTRANVEAAREKLRLWGLKPEQVTRIERSGKVSDHLTLYAHQAGIVVEKHRSEGEYVQEGSKIYTIADLTGLWVHLDAYESDLAWVRYGQAVEFETEAYPGQTFSGRVSFVDPVLDERTRTVKVRVNVDNAAGRLKPGMFVRGRVHAQLMGEGKVFDRNLAGKWISPMHPEVVEDGPGSCRVCGMPLVAAETLGFVGQEPTRELPLVVPATAPLLTGERAVVYVEVPDAADPTYQARVVRLGPRAGNVYVVRSGLREGERVVVQGAFKLDSALQIRAGHSMMSLPSEAPSPVEDLRGSRFMAGAEALVPALAAAAEALASGDADAASDGFATVREAAEALELEGLEGAARSFAQDLVGRLVEAATLGADAWEVPEQYAAFYRLSRSLRELGPAPDPDEEAAASLSAVRDLTVELAALLAADAEAEALAHVASSSALEAVRPRHAHDTLALTRWELHLLVKSLGEARDLATLRERFAVLSDRLVTLGTSLSPLSSGAEAMACPMAFDGRGARWIQAPGPVANPYFGAAMLRCGEPYLPEAP